MLTRSQMKEEGVKASTGSRETADDGDYNFIIEESKYGPNKKGNGTGISMKLTMLDGNFAGTSIYHYINVNNQNATAQSIGRGELLAILEILDIESHEELQGKMIRARIVGSMEDYVKRNGEKTKIVNLRPKLFMSLDGKNADGNDVQPFVPSSPTAKEELAEWRKANLSDNTSGAATGSGTSTGGSDGGQTSGGNTDLDDEIPFD